MSFDSFWNIARREIERFIRTNIAEPRIGVITQVDTGAITGRFCARVRILPEETLSGWLPIQSNWVGNGWGLLFVPKPGAQVYVSYLENDRRVGTITGLHFDNSNSPPVDESSVPAAAGDMWMVHENGQYFKMLSDGHIRVHSAAGIEVGNTGQPLMALIKDSCVSAINSHTHRVVGVQSGGGTVVSQGPTGTLISGADTTAILKAN